MRLHSTFFVALLVAVPLLSSCISAFGKAPSGERLEKIRAAKNAKEGQFQNPREEQLPSFKTALGTLPKNLFGDAVTVPKEEILIYRRAHIAKPKNDALEVTWLFHSTVLIDVGGVRVLTDPVFSQRASPFQWLGPKRFMPSPIALENIHDIDVVLISHDHYDHLDTASIKTLAQRDITFIVPLGVGAHLEHWGISASNIVEKNWWETIQIEGVKFTCVPARHSSGRSAFAQNKTLWAGWALNSDKGDVYFSGDTAFSSDFERIGRKLGPFDIALLEVGAYNPLWADSHMGPEQAILAHRLVRAKKLLPLHWATFNLAFHSVTEPVERLIREAALKNVELLLPMPGQSVNENFEATRWWPELAWKTKEEVEVKASSTNHEALEKKADLLGKARP